MIELHWIFAGITLLFFLLLIVKEMTTRLWKLKFCVVCGTISLSWTILLILHFMKIVIDTQLIAILMGQTIAGLFYLFLGKGVKERSIFGFPLLLTLTFVGYSVFAINLELVQTAVFLVLLWLVFGFVYLYRKNGQMSGMFKKIIECCRRW